MSLYYPQQSGSPYPPEQGPEEDYYEEADFEYEDDEFESSDQVWGSRILFFCAGGLLIFLCMSCCVLVGVGLWILDPGATTPPPGSDLGLTLEEPAPPFETVVNEQNVRLTIKDVNRNAALNTITPGQGQELIIVTVELVNESNEEITFDERDFLLLSGFGQGYEPIPGVVDGALGRGTLPSETGLEGRLVFEVPIGAQDLVMQWNGGLDAEPRFIYLP